MNQTIDLQVFGADFRKLVEASRSGATYVFENIETRGQGCIGVALREVVTSVRPLPVGCTAQLVKPLKLTEGTVLTEFAAGTQVRVGGYANFGGADVAVIKVIGWHYAGTVLPELLEAVPTAEQSAAKDRLEAIAAMMQKVVHATPHDCALLYDAGYRKL